MPLRSDPEPMPVDRRIKSLGPSVKDGYFQRWCTEDEVEEMKQAQACADGSTVPGYSLVTGETGAPVRKRELFLMRTPVEYKLKQDELREEYDNKPMETRPWHNHGQAPPDFKAESKREIHTNLNAVVER